MNKHEESKKKEFSDLREEFFNSIYPSVNYMPYFKEYFPEQCTDKKNVHRIRNCMKQVVLHEDITLMLKTIVIKIR